MSHEPLLHLVQGLGELARARARIDGLAEAVLAVGKRSLGAHRAVMWRRVGMDLVEEASSGPPTAHARRHARAIAAGVDAQTNVEQGDDELTRWWLVPVRSGQRIWGVMAFGAAATDAPADLGLDTAFVLAGWFAGAIDRHRADRRLREVLGELERMAHTDPLTHVLHRRGIERVLEEATVPHAAILVDIQGFRKLNDIHGYQVGDAVLSVTATALKRGIRPEDVVGRVGGDEFVVLLEGADETSAAMVAERLEGEIGEEYLQLSTGEKLFWSASFQVCPPDAYDLATLITPSPQPRRSTQPEAEERNEAK